MNTSETPCLRNSSSASMDPGIVSDPIQTTPSKSTIRPSNGASNFGIRITSWSPHWCVCEFARYAVQHSLSRGIGPGGQRRAVEPNGSSAESGVASGRFDGVASSHVS
jgi:hypothetical protein